MSRLRENPDRLFEVFLEVGKPTNEKEGAFILQKYPLDFEDEEVLKSVPKFAFPCDTERTTVDHFTFTLTDLDSKFKFGFCRHATGAQTCFCIISLLPWFEVFYNLLNVLAEITNRPEDNDVEHMLRAAYVQEVPSPSLPVTIVAKQEMFSFKAPEINKLPSIPSSRNLTEYYNAIDIENMTLIFASMLHERRIVVTSKKLSRLTAVVHAAVGLLYPMFWQHLFIPVLPASLIDYLSAPMPFVIGVHTKLMEKVRMQELGDAVIVDADESTVTTEYDDLNNLPEEMASYLKRHLKADKVKSSMQSSGDIISRTFMMSLVKLIGGYRDALKFTEGDPITFNPEAFVQSRPLSMQPFLENMLQLQIFQQFINDRLDMLNCGRGFQDIFEQECLLHADKLNAQTRYNEWVKKMKHQGKKFQKSSKDMWGDIKDKVKSSGKKAYKQARTKISDLKKEEVEGSPKQNKTARHGEKTKSFSKDRPVGLTKDRPSTIVGAPLTTHRPPRPPTSPGVMSQPRIVVQPSASRLTKLVSHHEPDNRISTDDTDLIYNRVSVNLLADPEIQHAMYKSASAENLPQTSLQTIGSSGTLSSESSDGDARDAQDGHLGGGASLSYTNLLEDDDSGIVMTTSSQTSLDRPRPDPYKTASSYAPSYGVTPPPRPAPRKSLSPSVHSIDDKIIRPNPSRERPQPAPRNQSFETNCQGDTNSLITLDTPTEDKTNKFDLVKEFSAINSSGDYVLLREPKTSNHNESVNNRRSSISRTPAMKLSQNETPKRPTIRRERSPEDSLVDFDPLYDSPVSQNHSQTATPSGKSDSLLKDWDLSDLTGVRKSDSSPGNQSIGHYSSPNPSPRYPLNMSHISYTSPRSHLPHPSSHSPFPQGQSPALNFSNPLAQGPPALPPKVPLPRPTVGNRSQLPQHTMKGSSHNPEAKIDPFADLVPSNSKPAPPTKPSWETFD